MYDAYPFLKSPLLADTYFIFNLHYSNMNTGWFTQPGRHKPEALRPGACEHWYENHYMFTSRANTGMPVLDVNPPGPQPATQSRCYVMLRSGKNARDAALSSRRLRARTKLLNEKLRTQPGLLSGLGVDGAVCSPWPLFILALLNLS